MLSIIYEDLHNFFYKYILQASAERVSSNATAKWSVILELFNFGKALYTYDIYQEFEQNTYITYYVPTT